MSKLSVVHWNDVYQVSPQKISSKSDPIDVTQFAALLIDIRSKWSLRSDGTRDGLSLFSGDLFSPSAESTVTRGSHMVPIMNELAPDVAVTGNHEFDFGYPHLTKLVKGNIFPWLLSNIVDANTGNVPEDLQVFRVIERSGVRIGIIGLADENWITTVGAWPSNFKYKDMEETGRELSRTLREEHECDLVIALTHARAPADLQLAKHLLALSPSAQEDHPIAGEHGIDIILGGHDHDYFISKGVTTWDGYDVSDPPNIGAEGDNGDTLVVKSGTDFRDLSEFTLELEDTPADSIRKKVIKAIRGKHHQVEPGAPSSKNMKKIVQDVLSSVSDSLGMPVCTTEVELDLRTQSVRSGETVAGNWFADVFRHAYDDTLQTKYGSGSDGVIITGGMLRSNTVYHTGVITLKNIMDILPFSNPMVVIELNGESLWDALEEGLSKYPEQEGRFPVISGICVSWDSRRPAGQRVLGVWLSQEVPKVPSEGPGSASGTATASGKAIKREKDGRTYKIVTTDYLATGHDGYTSLDGQKYLIEADHGQIPSSLVRKYLLGAHYVNNTIRLDQEQQNAYYLHSETANVVKQEIERRERVMQQYNLTLKAGQMKQQALASTLLALRSPAYNINYFTISAREHMSGVDYYDGEEVRRGGMQSDGKGKNGDKKIVNQEDLPAIHPVLDGRLKDVARS